MFIGFLIFTTIGLITPGPNNVLLLNSGLRFGYKKSIAHIIGIALGLFSMFIAVGKGVSIFFTRYPAFQSILQIVCVIYLLYLSYKIIISSTDFSDGGNIVKPMSFINALVFQWMNPKAWTLALTVIGLYKGLKFDNPILVISVCFLLVSLVTSSVWVGFGVQIKKILKNTKHQKILNVFMGCSLLGTLLLLL